MESKTLRPRASAKQDLDVIILVDGSEVVISTDFNKEKQLCLELAARLAGHSQLGVIQFGSKAQIVTPLTTNREELEKKVDGMTKVSGSANLSVAFEICYSEFSRSKASNNQRQIWIFTNGNFKQDPRNATLTEKLIREKQVTVIAIGIGHRIDMRLLNRLAAPGCCFLVGDFARALKLFQYNPNKERNCQISANIVFPSSVPFKLGESIVLRFEVENVGLKEIGQGAKVIFKENTYFREETVSLYETLQVGNQTSFYVKLQTKYAGTSVDSQLPLLPELIEFVILDSANNDVTCDCTGFFLNLEDFAGDAMLYKPLGVEAVNIMTFGPPGSGKSLFVNSICSALSDHIHNLAIVASPKKATGKTLQKFQLRDIPGFEQTAIALYDVPGVEESNFLGDELAQHLDGLVGNTNTKVYETVKGGFKFSPHEALAQRMHVIAFFVPPSVDDATWDLLQRHYNKITVEKKCRVVVIIGHSDTVLETEQRTAVHSNVCQNFSIDPSNVFFLENYVDVKDKQFSIDRNVLRVVLALLRKADEFIATQRSDPDASSSTTTQTSPLVIDPESLPRDEKEVLILENNEMHIHINKLQAQINALTNYKAGLESLLTEDQKAALRGENPPRSLVQQVSGLVYTSFSNMRALFVRPVALEPATQKAPPNQAAVVVPDRANVEEKPPAGPSNASNSSNSAKSANVAITSDAGQSSSQLTPTPQPAVITGPQYGAPRKPAPKGDGSLFSFANMLAPKQSPKQSPRLSVRGAARARSPSTATDAQFQSPSSPSQTTPPSTGAQDTNQNQGTPISSIPVPNSN